MSEVSSRSYPSRPFLAASIAVFRDGKVLLARRANPPGAERYSLPGGLVETGETLEEAALRELLEETGVTATIVAFNGHVEVIERDVENRIERHFVVASFIGRWCAGDGVVGPEATHILWCDPAAIAELPTTPQLAPLVLQAERRLAAT